VRRGVTLDGPNRSVDELGIYAAHAIAYALVRRSRRQDPGSVFLTGGALASRTRPPPAVRRHRRDFLRAPKRGATGRVDRALGWSNEIYILLSS
jgi:hypothetical protein